MAAFAGLDTSAEVNQLLSGIVVTPGTTIAHEAVEEILGLERRSTRYHTITTRWRRALRRTQNIDMQGIPGVGFRVLSEPERLDISVRDFTRSARGMHRAYDRLGAIRVYELPDDKRVQHDHTRRAPTNDGVTAATEWHPRPPVARGLVWPGKARLGEELAHEGSCTGERPEAPAPRGAQIRRQHERSAAHHCPLA
jgi:hypothetical protein